MNCTVWNFCIVQGDIFANTLEFIDETDETPVDITSYTEIAMQVRKKPDTDVLVEGKMSTNEFSVTAPNIVNIVGLEFNIPVGNYIYDIEFSATNVRETLLRGIISVLPQSTVLE